MKIPNLKLTHGQALFALNLGHAPDQVLVNQLRHLRRLGVPFEGGEDRGHGNRVRYDFDHLVETGAAMFALRNHMPPRSLAAWFAAHRTLLRRAARRAWKELPERALEPDWIKKRGGALMSGEIYFRLHDRASERPGVFDFVNRSDLVDVLKSGFIGERFDDQQLRPVLALKGIAVEVIPRLQARCRYDAPSTPESDSIAPSGNNALLIAVVQAAPRYPAKAIEEGIEAEVRLLITIEPDGTVSSAQVVNVTWYPKKDLSWSPDEEFARSATNAVMAWRYRPPGRRIVGAAVNITFHLD